MTEYLIQDSTLTELADAVRQNTGTSSAMTTSEMVEALTTSVIPISKGGTGATTVAAARNALGLGNTSGALPIANGGTGKTVLAANAVLVAGSQGSISLAEVAPSNGAFYATSTSTAPLFGTLPIGQGGTGATTAADARTRLGVSASANPVFTGTLSQNRLSGSTSGNYSAVLGYNNTASGANSFAAGSSNTSSGWAGVALGYNNKATGNYGIAMGYGSTASNTCAVAIGNICVANSGQSVFGHYNTSRTSGASTTGTSGDALIIGNGTNTATSNAFRVTFAGAPYALSSLNTSGADYAEFFEWLDENKDNEDRRGYFVTMDGDKIKIAGKDDYILGIVSGQPAVIGNSDECWRNKYVHDDFGAFVYEEFEYDEIEIDSETGEETIVKRIGERLKINPDFNPEQEYVQRKDRPEWDAVGMVGVLTVRDDNTCEVNGFCRVGEGGIATSSDTNVGYRVIKRIADNIVKIIFK